MMIEEASISNNINRSLGIRMMDVLISTILLICTLPLMVVTGLLIMIFDGGPILFRQVRPGLGMQDITIIKFRTMLVGAEALENHKIELLKEPNVQTEDDDRVTKIGAVLRRLSLDELPQLFLVLCGQMSLVGPRPLIKAEVNGFHSKYLTRYNVLPGVSGLAQVSGRSRLSVWEMLNLDLKWVEHYSIGLYLKILWKTPSVILKIKEAC